MIFYTDPDYLDQAFLGECSEVSKLCAQICCSILFVYSALTVHVSDKSVFVLYSMQLFFFARISHLIIKSILNGTYKVRYDVKLFSLSVKKNRAYLMYFLMS